MTRRRYVYDPVTKTMREGSGPRRVDGPSGDGWRFSDRLYSANPFVAPDGTLIDSKKKHREYMKRAGVTTMDDFTEHWAKKRAERDAFYTGNDPRMREERKRDIIETIERLQARR